MIIAVDFDNTLFDGKQVNVALINRLKHEQRKGSTVILWTCRDGRRISEALSILQQNGFKPNLVNENAPETIKKLGYNPRKVLADAYIDDKNIVLK